MTYFDAEPDRTLLNKAHAIAAKAVVLDERDAIVHFVLGRVHLARGEYADSVRELETSAELNPCFAQAHCGLGDVLACSGRLDEALLRFERAIRLSPFDPYRWGFYSCRSLAHIFLRDFEAAADGALKATQGPHAQYWSYAYLVAALGYLERPEQTRAALTALMKLKPEFSCGFVRTHLIHIKDPAQMEVFTDGLRRAGAPEFSIPLAASDSRPRNRPFSALRSVPK
jgi:tetratricopeptide (TPR) repeat protein